MTGYQEALQAAQRWCDTLPAGSRVLDAGSGLRSYVTFPPEVHVTGVDVSQELLDANPRLDDRLLADLEQWQPRERYDCVVCWEVLEHLRNPETVIGRLALAAERLLVVGSPNPRSVKGLVTRFSPHRFHRWLYQQFYEGGNEPYPTFMRPGGSLRSVKESAERVGLSCVYVAEVESPMQAEMRRRLKVTGWVWGAVRLLVRVVSLGLVSPDKTDYVAVFRR